MNKDKKTVYNGRDTWVNNCHLYMVDGGKWEIWYNGYYYMTCVNFEEAKRMAENSRMVEK